MKSKFAIMLLLAVSLGAAGLFAGPRVVVGVGVGYPHYGYAAYPYGYHPRGPVPVAGYVAAPGPGYAWVGGYWSPYGRSWGWRAGYWARPPYVGAAWVRPRYYGGRYYAGYWRRR